MIERSGRGTRVAIVDSGVDASHPWLARAALSHVAVVRKGELFTAAPGASGDSSGHGTACAGIIHRMIPEAELISVCAIGPEGRCSREALVAALRYCVRQRFDVVNLSLGIDVPRSAPLRPGDYKSIVDLYEVADAAYTAGVLLVASGPNVASFRTYPGRVKSLVGVGRADFGDEDGLASEVTADHEILAPGNDILAPALGGGERRWTGTSFAAPHVTAHLARLRAARRATHADAAAAPVVEALKADLHRLAAASPPRVHAPADADRPPQEPLDAPA